MLECVGGDAISALLYQGGARHLPLYSKSSRLRFTPINSRWFDVRAGDAIQSSLEQGRVWLTPLYSLKSRLKCSPPDPTSPR